MRFRKSISICKGVKLNLSKSGASVTVGPGKGVSFNLGTKGAYFNWSIPGTGVYDRVRVDTLVKDKLGGLFGGAKAEEDKPAANGRSAKTGTKSGAKSGAKAAPAKKASGPSEVELARLQQEMALVCIQQLAPDVKAKATGTLDADKADAAIEDWLSEAEAPIEFSIQTDMVPEKATVMIDLDLPEIEDMPQDKLTELADGTLKIKKKTQKESRADYQTCVFGLGAYVAAHVLNLAPAARQAVVSAYTQRRNEKTGDVEDVFIYSVVYTRDAFCKGYQQQEPEAFAGKLRSRYYVLSSGVMKGIAPFEAEEI
ncbi:MAG: DUF4236 domain-containing protein [Candidatus Ventricola sp.]